MAKPGVMIYFDIRPGLRRLTTEERGELFDVILDYAEFGKEPDVNGMVGLAWDLIRPKIDRDTCKYNEQITKKQYAVYVREEKKKGNKPLKFDDWLLSHDNTCNQQVSHDNNRHLTTSVTTDVTINKADLPRGLEAAAAVQCNHDTSWMTEVET